VDAGTSIEQGVGLARGHLAAADDQHVAVFQISKQGVKIHWASVLSSRPFAQASCAPTRTVTLPMLYACQEQCAVGAPACCANKCRRHFRNVVLDSEGRYVACSRNKLRSHTRQIQQPSSCNIKPRYATRTRA